MTAGTRLNSILSINVDAGSTCGCRSARRCRVGSLKIFACQGFVACVVVFDLLELAAPALPER